MLTIKNGTSIEDIGDGDNVLADGFRSIRRCGDLHATITYNGLELAKLNNGRLTVIARDMTWLASVRALNKLELRNHGVLVKFRTVPVNGIDPRLGVRELQYRIGNGYWHRVGLYSAIISYAHATIGYQPYATIIGF